MEARFGGGVEARGREREIVLSLLLCVPSGLLVGTDEGCHSLLLFRPTAMQSAYMMYITCSFVPLSVQSGYLGTDGGHFVQNI